MGRVSSLLLIFLLCISTFSALTSCSRNSQKDASNVSSSPIELSIESRPSISQGDETSSIPTVQSGKILVYTNEKIAGFPSQVLGTQNELSRWEDIAQSSNIIHIEVCNMENVEEDLPLELAESIVDVLTTAKLKLFDSLGNPMTGGGIHVIAYDEDGKVLFHTVYDGEWFSVQFENEALAYVFDGSGTILDNLSNYIPG